MIKGLPEKLRDLRIKHGFSQRETADKLNVSPSVISGYETGERTPSTEILLAISYLYNCSTDYLLGRSQNAPEAVIDAKGLKQEQIQAISNLIKTIVG